MLRRRPVGARRPWPTIAVAAAALVLLALLGRGVNDELKATSISVPGTESSRGSAMLREHFGHSAPFAILLQGPPAQVDRQGPHLIETLRRTYPKVTTVSPWDRGQGVGALRPNRRTALALVDFHVSGDTAMNETVPQLERLVDEEISSPVRARAAGFATISRAIREESVEVTRRGEAILAPILLIVLLFVFRSPVAAAIPLIFGATTIVAARGLISVVAGFVDISGFALSIATMIGLAVGVDYALLIVSRFREELQRGVDPAEAAALTRATAGRTILFAGGILLMAVVIAVCLVPGALLLSLCATVGPVIVVAVAGPWLVGPAILVLVGANIDRWRIGSTGPVRTRWLVISRTALRRPGVAATAIGVLLVLIASPAASLATGPVTVEELSRDDPARLDVEAIEAAVGGGWIAPEIVVAVSERGPITQHRKLAALNRWQVEVAHEPGVQAVVGPGRLVKQLAPLRQAGRQLVGGGAGGSHGEVTTASLERAGSGLTRLRRGLGLASEGAQALALGSGRAEAGAGLIADGLSLAASGGDRAHRALERFRRGSHLLVGGQRGAALGMSLLDFEIEELGNDVALNLPRAKRIEAGLSHALAGASVSEAAATTTVEKLEAAWQELRSMGVGTSDPRYPALEAAVREALTAASGRDPLSAAAFAPGFDGLPAALAESGREQREMLTEAKRLDSELSGIAQSITGMRKLAARLQSGVSKLEDGSRQLAGGSDKIVNASVRLGSGLTRLASGAVRLDAGLLRLRDGNAKLAKSLSLGFRRARPLVLGAREAEIKITSASRRLERSSPGIFDSGYFALSALDGAPPRSREIAGQAIDLATGGQAAKILVIDSDLGSDGFDATALNENLRDSARRLAARSGLQVAVTGGVAQSIDYERSTSSRLPLLVLAITLATFLVMLAILRALPLAALAITLNLLAVAAAFGVLEVLTLLPEDWPFGGTHHVDPVGAAGIFGVVFGLSIDYAVFLLMRMREGWERHRDNDAAISYGLERTASVITGAATIMTVVFMILATAPIQSVAQFGVSLTVAVMLDATVIRLMLAPALMKLIGPRIWWLPAWLERRLPRLDVHGEQAAL